MDRRTRTCGGPERPGLLISTTHHLPLTSSHARVPLLAGGGDPRDLLSDGRHQIVEGHQQDVDGEEPDVDFYEQTYQSLNEEDRVLLFDIAWGLVKHAAHGSTNSDRSQITVAKEFVELARNPEKRAEYVAFFNKHFTALKTWGRENRVKAVLLLLSMGGFVLSKDILKKLCLEYIGPYNESYANPEVNWSSRLTWFTTLMVLRLFVTVVVPPLSPLFAALIDDGVPETQQALAMPAFLAASTLAGAAPQTLDFVVTAIAHHLLAPRLGPRFETHRPVSRLMTWWIEFWPATCWISGGMKHTFNTIRAGRTDAKALRYAAIMVILAGHVMLFAGAGVTWIAIGITPFLTDNIGAQPFGLTEDLMTIAFKQFLRGDIKIAQRGFLTLATSLHAFQAWTTADKTQKAKAVIMSTFAAGILFLLEAVQRGEDPLVAQEHWRLFLCAMVVNLNLFLPHVAEGISKMLEWAFKWEEEQGHDMEQGHFVQLVDGEREEAPMHDRQPGGAVRGDGVLQRAARRGAGMRDNDFLPGQDEANPADDAAAAENARNTTYVTDGRLLDRGMTIVGE